MAAAARVLAAGALIRAVHDNVRAQAWVDPQTIRNPVVVGAAGGERFNPHVWYITEWIAIYGRITGAYTLDEFVADVPMGNAGSKTPVTCARKLFSMCGYTTSDVATTLAEVIATAEIPGGNFAYVPNQGFRALLPDWDERNIPGLVDVAAAAEVAYMVPPSAYAVLQYALLQQRNASDSRTALLVDMMRRLGCPVALNAMLPDHLDAVRWLADHYKTPPPQAPPQVAAGAPGVTDAQRTGVGLIPVRIYSWDYLEARTRLREEQQANAELRGNAGVSVDVLSTLKMEVRVAKEAHAALQRETAAQIQAERAGAEATRRLQVAKIDELQREVRVQTARSATLAQLTQSLHATLAMVNFNAPAGAGAGAAAVAGGAGAPVPLMAQPPAAVSMTQARCGTVCGLFEPLSLLVPLPDQIPGHIDAARQDARNVCEYIFYSTPQLWMMFLYRHPVRELIRMTLPDAQLSPVIRAVTQIVNADNVTAATRAMSQNMFPPNSDMAAWRQIFQNEHINVPILDELHIGAYDATLPQMRRIGWYGRPNNAVMNGFFYSKDNHTLVAAELPPRIGGTEIWAVLQRGNRGNMPRIFGAPMIAWNPV